MNLKQTKQVKFLVEDTGQSIEHQDFIKAIRRAERQVFILPRSRSSSFDVSFLGENDLVLCYGSIKTIKNLKTKVPKGCFPVAFYTEENYLCSKYYPVFKEFLFNDNHEFLTVKKLKDEKFEIYAKYGKEAVIFTRPDRGDKPFAGQLLDLQDFDKFWDNRLCCEAEDDDIVIVSTPKNIRGEWRFFCSDKVVAFSTYMYQGQITKIPGAPKGAIKLAESLVSLYRPDPMFCLDICEDNDGKFWLLEVNSFSSAGLYAADKSKIVNFIIEEVENNTIINKL